MGLLGNFFKKLFVGNDADYKKIDLIGEQVNLRLQQSEIKRKIILAERQLREDLKAAKGDPQKEAEAYQKCREAYKKSGYKNFQKKQKELIQKEIDNRLWERI